MSNPIDLLPAILTQLAPYAISGPMLSHILAQWDLIKKKETPDWLKISLAYAMALGATFGSNLLNANYAGGAPFSTYAANTLQQSGLLFGTMTLANVSMDKFIPSLADWGTTTLTRFIVAIRKGVDTLINRGQPPAVQANG